MRSIIIIIKAINLQSIKAINQASNQAMFNIKMTREKQKSVRTT